MSNKENGGNAFPQYERIGEIAHAYDGMTLRQYAAIKLRVPDSGTDWLDEMIDKACRLDASELALAGVLANPNGGSNGDRDFAHWAQQCAKSLTEARK